MTRASASPPDHGRARPAQLAAGLMVLSLCACAVTPAYNPPRSMPASGSIGAGTPPDAPVFDSLARVVQLPPAATPGATPVQENVALGVLHDSVLARLVSTALRENQDLRAGAARIDEYRAQVGSARSELFPELDGNASASTNQIAIGASPPIAYKALRATADLKWELDFWGRIRKGVAAADADRAARDDDLEALKLTIVADVSDGYLELLSAREERDVSQRAFESRQSTLGLARQRFAQGVISELDVRQFEADVAGAASSVAQFTRIASQREHALSLLLGQGPGPIAGGGTLDAAITSIGVPDSVSASLLVRRPDVMSAERALAAEQARMGSIRAAILPRFMITSEYGTQSPTASQLFGAEHEVYALQLGMSVPLFAGGRQSSELAAERARIEQARAHYEQVVLRAASEAADALVGVRTGRQQLAAQTAQANALRDGYRLAQRRYEGGIASYLEVLDAQRGLFAAEIATSESRRSYLEAVVALYKALGGRWTGMP
jgi:multidrug efflux system outer membrane protein